MRLFTKYFAIALVGQSLLLCLGAVGSQVSPSVDLLFEWFLLIYEPMILLIASIGTFKGESAMIEPVWMGIGSGALIYGITFGFGAILLKGLTTRIKGA